VRSFMEKNGFAGSSQSKPNSAWVDGFGETADAGSKKGFNGYRYTLGGVSAGTDYLIKENFLAGASFGQSHSALNFDRDMGSGDIESTLVSLYGSLFDDKAYLDGAVSYGRETFRNNRLVEVGNIVREAHSKHNGDLFSLYTEGGYNFAMEKWLLEPFASLQYIYLDEESFREAGADGVNLIVGDRRTSSLVSDFGLRFMRPFTNDVWNFVPDITVTWRHDYDIDDRHIHAAFDGSPANTFTTESRDLDRDGIIIGGGLTLINKGGMSSYFRYDGEIRGKFDAQRMSGGMRLEF